MKCPVCGVWSSVLQTRSSVRRRECANGHRFNTVEKTIGTLARRQDWARNLKIINDPRGASAVGRDYGISEARVREIRSKHARIAN